MNVGDSDLPRWPRGPGGITEVLRVAVPLMISTGCLSVVLFIDRTLLMRFDGDAMSAAMAAGNVFWTLICLPNGIASMTGAFVAQYIGARRPTEVGKFLWQAVFFSLATTPVWCVAAWFAPQIFNAAGQPSALIGLETSYMRVLMFGAIGGLVESSLSGFFSGTHRTLAVMWINIAATVINLALDIPLIFGWGPIPAGGIVGAACASVIAFWFKAIAYAVLLCKPEFRGPYAIVDGFQWCWPMFKRLLFFGFPAGLQYFFEAGAFTLITLQIGEIGSVPLQATTMAINFNMLAFVPLVGVSIAASVVVGQHLTGAGSRIAVRAARTALLIGLVYSSSWALLYVAAPEFVISFYQWIATANISGTGASIDPGTAEAIGIANGLLVFVAGYVLVDSCQLVLGGVLRGAGDTWYVLLATAIASGSALTIGIVWEPDDVGVRYWWYVITGWIWLLALLMTARYWQGVWKEKRLVDQEESMIEQSGV